MKRFLFVVGALCLALGLGYAETDTSLDNAGLYELAYKVGTPGSNVGSIRGTEVKLNVWVRGVREESRAHALVRNPNPNFNLKHESVWSANIINFRHDFFSRMEKGEEYVIEGIIVEDRIDYGAFWIYVNKFEKVE